jgi:hypothetical protein
MNRLIVVMLIVCMGGACTTLHPIGGTPSELSQQIAEGGILHPGDHVVITTVQGNRHEFVVRSVHDGAIHGDHDSVPLNEIVKLQRREFSAGKTVILVLVVLGVVGGIAAAASSAAPAFALSGHP